MNTHEEQNQQIEPLRASISRPSAANLRINESPNLETALRDMLEGLRQGVQQISVSRIKPIPPYG